MVLLYKCIDFFLRILPTKFKLLDQMTKYNQFFLVLSRNLTQSSIFGEKISHDRRFQCFVHITHIRNLLSIKDKINRSLCILADKRRIECEIHCIFLPSFLNQRRLS
ncbi:hypothetical protein D3C76_1562420 [compost metagenome]